jgi:hypothetical protein
MINRGPGRHAGTRSEKYQNQPETFAKTITSEIRGQRSGANLYPETMSGIRPKRRSDPVARSRKSTIRRKIGPFGIIRPTGRIGRPNSGPEDGNLQRPAPLWSVGNRQRSRRRPRPPPPAARSKIIGNGSRHPIAGETKEGPSGSSAADREELNIVIGNRSINRSEIANTLQSGRILRHRFGHFTWIAPLYAGDGFVPPMASSRFPPYS